MTRTFLTSSSSRRRVAGRFCEGPTQQTCVSMKEERSDASVETQHGPSSCADDKRCARSERTQTGFKRRDGGTIQSRYRHKHNTVSVYDIGAVSGSGVRIAICPTLSLHLAISFKQWRLKSKIRNYMRHKFSGLFYMLFIDFTRTLALNKTVNSSILIIFDRELFCPNIGQNLYM